MKKIQLIPILLLGASLFSACHKQDATTVAPVASMADNTTGYVYNSAIVYQLTVNKSAGSSILVWDGGYIHVSGCTFNPIYTDGTLNQGATKSANRFGQQMDVTMPMFGPATLGTGMMPAITFGQANLTIQLTPKGSTMAMQLNGRFNFAPDMPPYPPHHVQFIVNEPVNLNSQWLQNVTLTTSGVKSMMTLDLGQLANGIGYGLMNSATLTGDTIYISATQNTEIYNIMMSNLKSMLLDITLTTNQVATPDAAAM